MLFYTSVSCKHFDIKVKNPHMCNVLTPTVDCLLLLKAAEALMSAALIWECGAAATVACKTCFTTHSDSLCFDVRHKRLVIKDAPHTSFV